MVKTAILVSGGGSNLQAIIDAKISGEIKNCELSAVIASKPDIYAIKRAQDADIPVFVIERSIFPHAESYTKSVLDKLQDLEIELVVHAGFNYILSSEFTDVYKNRAINIHPSLIPSFCGPGFYGLRTHEAVIAHGVKLSGATAHFVTDVCDGGPIILQKAVSVLDDDTPQTLQRRVMEEAEWKILPEAISLFCEGRLKIDGRIVRIKKSI